jgi:raffinose/stachyose/melibiose transport system permease protein
MRKRYGPKTLVGEILVAFLALLFILPLYFVVSVSLKPKDEIFTSALKFSAHPEWGNFAAVWNAGVQEALMSTAIITVGSVVALIIVGSLCAYVLARRKGRLSSGFYLMFILGITVPFQLSILPIYYVFNKLGLVGTHLGMIILWVGAFMPMTILLYTGFFKQLPKDYEEAARIDGAKTIRIFMQVIFPQLRPVTGSVAIIIGLAVWNDFFASLIFVGGSPARTLPVVIYSFVGQYVSQWNLVFASILLALLPVIIVFIFMQKHMIKGFAGGMKG